MCQRGYFKVVGEERCDKCPKGVYKATNGNATSCEDACFADSTSELGATDKTQCYCKANFKLFVSQECPEGEFCAECTSSKPRNPRHLDGIALWSRCFLETYG